MLLPDIHNDGFGFGVGCAWFAVNSTRPSARAGMAALLVGSLGALGAMACEWFADDNFTWYAERGRENMPLRDLYHFVCPCYIRSGVSRDFITMEAR